MRIEKLEIKKFGKLENLTLHFKEGMNIVFGGNESGKTTVQIFIKGMFYGLKGGRPARDGTLPPLKRYKPWIGNEYNGFLEYRLDNGNLYRVGRNFDTNVVTVNDASFNDITDSFEASRDRGVQFAEKHLGLSESCFEKTVFIKQMESKVDEDGSRQLFNRLLNVSQTGFEDVSLIRAQEALKEALKQYVGTDKTSTRPLDKIIARLEELKSARIAALGKRDSAFRIERELNIELKTKEGLENRKNTLALCMDALALKKEIEGARKQRDELKEIWDNIVNGEKELDTVQKRLEELNNEKIKFERFSHFGNDDVDELATAYHNLAAVEESDRRLQRELDKRREEFDALKVRLEQLKSFESFNDEDERTVLRLNKELEHLRQEKSKNNMEALDERVKAAANKNKLMFYGLTASLFLVMLFICAGFAASALFYFAVPAAVIAAAFFGYLKAKASKEFMDIVNIKSIAFVFHSSVAEELDFKQAQLDAILDSAGVERVEDFLILRAEYNNTNQRLKALEEEIEGIRRDMDCNRLKKAGLKECISEKLIACAVIHEASQEIKEEHINEFKFGVRKYLGLEPSMNYAKERKDYVAGNLEELRARAVSLCGMKFGNADSIAAFVDEADKRISILEEEFEKGLDTLTGICSKNGIYIKGLEEIKEKFKSMDAGELEKLLSYNLNTVCEELSNAMLKIKEYETLLKNLYVEEGNIEKIDGEINELEMKKSELEDMSISLKTAMDVLTEASVEIQRDFTPALNMRMSLIISKITQGRYSDLRADDKLNLKAVSVESGGIVPVVLLSGGTVDQVYLALRLAMADLLSEGGESLPIIMDEVFAQYDDVRTTNTLRYFVELSSRKQVVLFTCKSREVDIAREIFGDKLNLIRL